MPPKKYLAVLILACVATFLFYSISVHAQGQGNIYKNIEKIPGANQTTDDFCTYTTQIINFGFAVIGILAMFMLMIGAYQYLMAAGNLAKSESAKDSISSALLGLALGLTAWLILNTINPALVKCDLKGGGVGSGGSSPIATPGAPEGPGSGKPGPGAGKCVEGTGNCSPDKMGCFGDQAKNAAIICNAESGGAAGVGSGTDKCGSSSVSWGLMQINVSCHNIGGNNCSGAVSCCYDGINCNKSNCTIKDMDTFSKCVKAAQDPSTNIEYACKLYAQRGFKPWTTARKCKII